MIRLPELHEQLKYQDAGPDASQALELDELTQSAPKLIGDVSRDLSDVHQNDRWANCDAAPTLVMRSRSCAIFVRGILIAGVYEGLRHCSFRASYSILALQLTFKRGWQHLSRFERAMTEWGL